MKIYFDSTYRKLVIDNKYYTPETFRFVFSDDNAKLSIFSSADNTQFAGTTLITDILNESDVAYTDKADFLENVILPESDSFQTVEVQDQKTSKFHRYFMTEDKTDITLTATVFKGSNILNVSSGHGFVAGATPNHYMIINYGSYFQQVRIVNVATNAITIESPVGISLPIEGVQIIRGTIDMNVDASTTNKTYYCRVGENSKDVHVIQIGIFMRDATQGDGSTFGGISGGITNGCLAVYEAGEVTQPLGVYRNNQSIEEFGGVVKYDDNAPSGEYAQTFRLHAIENYGSVFVLNASKYMTYKTRDNLSLLTHMRIAAFGHVTD